MYALLQPDLEWRNEETFRLADIRLNFARLTPALPRPFTWPWRSPDYADALWGPPLWEEEN